MAVKRARASEGAPIRADFGVNGQTSARVGQRDLVLAFLKFTLSIRTLQPMRGGLVWISTVAKIFLDSKLFGLVILSRASPAKRDER